jgi:proliferating cell nuclear antigen
LNQNVKIYKYSGGDKISEFNLSLLNLDSENLGIPDTEFTSVVTMPSN